MDQIAQAMESIKLVTAQNWPAGRRRAGAAISPAGGRFGGLGRSTRLERGAGNAEQDKEFKQRLLATFREKQGASAGILVGW